MKTQILTKLPGKPNTTLHLTPINPGESEIRYTVTGHTIQTVEMTAAEVIARFFHFDEKVGENEIAHYLTIVAKDQALIEISADVRHGNKGFRANRYELVDATNQKHEWDEWPMFFETLDQAIETFSHPVESARYIEASKAARLRF